MTTQTTWKLRIVGHDRVAPDQLTANPYNHRRHPQKQRDALAAAIREVGFIRSVTVNKRTGNLIDGHERVWQALQAEVPLIDVEYVDLSEEDERKALALLDKIGELAEVDPEALDALLREIETGEAELQALLAEMAADAGLYAETGEVVEDEVPEPPADPVTKPGDLWLLGEHRLLCGDSTSAEDVGRLMQGAKARLCFTSPPYAQQRDYTPEGKAKVSDWDGLMQGVFGNLPMAPDGQVLVNLGLVHREGEWWPYWDGWIEWMRSQGWRRFGWYVWDQGFGLPGDWNGRLAPSHEFLFHFNRAAVTPSKWVAKKAENIKKRNKVESTMRGKDGTTQAFTNPGASGQPTKVPDSIVRVCRQVGSDGHPAQFPVNLPLFAMRTWPGDVYEPFSGSGTTLIAAEQLNRRAFCMEIAPAYCDIAIERWERLTGGKATRE